MASRREAANHEAHAQVQSYPIENKTRPHRLKAAKVAVIVSLRLFEWQRSYRHSIDEFVASYCSAPRLSFNKAVVLRYRLHLEDRRLAAGTINVRLAAYDGWHTKPQILDC
jgi:hypothetical protein